MKTLIIEDEPLTRLFHEWQIDLLGFEYTSYEDAETALAAYYQNFYPLIISDLNLPGMTGIEFCHRIRALPKGEQSIILIVSGSSTPENIQAAINAGADEFLSKPVNSTLIWECVTNLIERISS
jgi:CheY-like chemotaxis protein